MFTSIFVLIGIAAVLLITGKLADWCYKAWGDSRLNVLLLGGVTDLRTLKIFHRILGVIILILVIALYIAASRNHS
jgi:uncharacterized membrane protein